MESKQALDIKMPGETNPEFAKVVSHYLSNFSYYRVKKNYAVRNQLYEWCSQNLGEKYKDWFIWEGGVQDKWWAVNIRSQKKGTWFALRWTDIIIERVDRQKD